jgi:hypothetical protein
MLLSDKLLSTYFAVVVCIEGLVAGCEFIAAFLAGFVFIKAEELIFVCVPAVEGDVTIFGRWFGVGIGLFAALFWFVGWRFAQAARVRRGGKRGIPIEL